MATQWFCKIADKDYGPFTSEQLAGMAARGQLRPEHLVRKAEQGRWVAASQVQGLFASAGSQVRAAPRRTSDSSSSSMKLQVAQPLEQPVQPAATPRAAAPRAAAPPPRRTAPAAPPPAAAPPPPRSAAAHIPVGTPVGIIVPSAPSSFVPAQNATVVGGENSVVRARKRGPSLGVILGAGAAVCVVLGVAIGLAVSFSKSKPKNSGDQQVAANEPGIAADNQVGAGGSDAAGQSGANGQTLSPQEPAGVGEGEDNASDAARAQSRAWPQVSKSISKWYEAPRTIAGLKNVVRLQVLSAWHSTDPAGGPAPHAGDTSDPQYLFVEVQITNASENDILAYTSWNGTSPAADEVVAMLFDGSGQACRLVPSTKAPAEGRQRNAQIQPGDIVKDVLVFELPADRPQSLQLALPLAAFGRDGFLGFQLPAAIIAERAAAPAPQVAADARQTDSPPADAKPETISLAVEPAQAEPTTKPAPLTFDDLRRSIEKSAGGPSPEEKQALSDAEQRELERVREAVKKQQAP